MRGDTPVNTADNLEIAKAEGRRPMTQQRNEETDMSGPDGDETRSVAEDGTQTDAQASPAAGRSAGPAPSVGGEQQPGGPVPPYEGRRESAEIDEGGADRDGAHVGGATGPRISSEPPDDPDSTPLGRTASPAGDGSGGEGAPEADHAADPGVGPAHQEGVRRGEDTPR